MTPAPGWGAVEPAVEPWRHGRWSVSRVGDELADVVYDGSPVLRSIRAVVRDRDWRTVAPSVDAVHASDAALLLALRFTGLGADLRGELALRAEGDRLAVDLRLTARSGFARNRIGLVVLHAAELAGTAFAVEHPDGSSTAGRFPQTISPHQPAIEIAALRWHAHGVEAELELDGDVFEMEDQRNWTDASFKTYSTPLRTPFPVLVHEGDRIRQRLVLTCLRTADDAPTSEPSAVDLEPRNGRLPRFGLGATTEPLPPPDPADADLLVELRTDRPAWRTALHRATEEAGAGGLDVRIVTDLPDVVREVLAEVERLVGAGVRLLRIGVFSPVTHLTGDAAWIALRDGVRARGLTVALLGGSRAHFTELNRGHGALPADLPALAFGSTPQMHAVESRQLVESIDAQRRTAVDAVRIADGRPVHVGPVTLRPRFNAVATSTPAPGPAEDADATDLRQGSAALGTWMIASAAALACDGIASVSWFEGSGPRGTRSSSGEELPVHRAAQELLALSDAPALDATAAPRHVHVLGGAVDDDWIVLVANLRSEPVRIVLRLAGQERPLLVPALGLARASWPRTASAARTSAHPAGVSALRRRAP